MKSHTISKPALAVAIGALLGGAVFAPVANAVHLTQDGNFEAGWVNYYTVRNNWSTAFSLTNTSGATAAVKIRLHEGYNSRDVLDFNVILSPYDVWQAWLAEDENGTPRLYTNDESCTVPAIPSEGQPLLTGAFTGDAEDVNPDDSTIPLTIERTKEGHITAILMGFADPTNEDGLGYAAVHEDGIPRDCGALVEAFGGVTPAALNSLRAATDGFGADSSINPLTGQWSLTNPSAGNVTAGGRMVGLANFADYNVENGGLVTLQRSPVELEANGFSEQAAFEAGFFEPSLASATTNGEVLLGDGTPVAVYTNSGGTDGANAVSFVLSRDSLYNQWTSRPSSGAAFDWDTSTDFTATFVTKRYYVDRDTSSDGSNIFAGRYQHVVGLPEDSMTPGNPDGAPAPFSNYWDDKDGFSCDRTVVTLYDREEFRIGGGTPPFSPSPFESNSLCTETNVINFGERTAFPSALLSTIPEAALPGKGGTARLAFPDARDLVGSVTLMGLPVTGDAFIQRLVDDGITTSANDVFSVPHAYSRDVR